MHIVLFQPRIPPNTGNIARQCVGMNAALHLIGPPHFDLSEHAVKRAGLDYWKHLNLIEHATPPAFLDWLGNRPPWLITKRGDMRYDRAAYAANDVLIFGNEIDGLPPEWHARWPDRRIFIPILGNVRSYNLANAAALVMAQAYSTAGIYDGPPQTT